MSVFSLCFFSFLACLRLFPSITSVYVGEDSEGSWANWDPESDCGSYIDWDPESARSSYGRDSGRDYDDTEWMNNY